MTHKSPIDTTAVRTELQQNADRAGLVTARIHVTRTEYGGFRVRVVHDSLAALSDSERRALILSGIEDDIDHHELVTSDEEEWYGPPFLEVENDLPTWPEVLEKSPVGSPLIFASDLDQLSRPVAATFYSPQGGVGRSTALAAAARILAARGNRVLCIDMDFEAPGLPYLFGLDEPEPNHGVVPLLLELERDENVAIRDHIQRVTEEDELHCLPAGSLGADYAQRLRLIDPEIWYRETPNPLHRMIDLAGSSSIRPDILLLDAATGLSPTSAPLLFDVSDLAVICFFPHPQTRHATELVARSLFNANSRRTTEDLSITPEPRFLVCPVPPGPSAEVVRDTAISWVDEWLSQVDYRRPAEVGQLVSEKLIHTISYSPEMALADRLDDSSSLNDVYGPVADWMEHRRGRR